MSLQNHIKTAVGRMSPRKRQYTTLGLFVVGGVGILWLVFSFADSNSSAKPAPKLTTATAGSGVVTNVAVPGQISAIDEWVGTAGKKLAQYEKDKATQDRMNDERRQFEASVLKRLGEVENNKRDLAMPAAALPGPAAMPAMPAAPLPVPGGGLPPGQPGQPGQPVGVASLEPEPEEPPVMRVSLADPGKPAAPAERVADGSGKLDRRQAPSSFLPVSFVRGEILAGIDAPTGGQSQSNPLPVLIRLADNAFLPNRYRAEVKDCFVIGSGYGDISSERAYIRTINISCVRHDRTRLEVDIKGNVYGEDGKLGLRGRLVTKQGQLLANSLRAGIVSGIGQGFSQSGTTVSGSALGNITTQSGGFSDSMQRGLGRGVGNAMERLADYYLKLAEQTFPIIEIDAGRQIEIVITSGVEIGPPLSAQDDDDTPLQGDRQ